MAILSIQINYHAETPKSSKEYKRHGKLRYSSICYIGSMIGSVSTKEVHKL